MNVLIKSVHIENFKGIKSLDVNFGNKTTIAGRNAVGKTTVLDAILRLLFGKNSQYVEKFDVRPLDENGKAIDFVDIIVSAVLSADGKEYELKKTQKQKWVKQRGSENAVFQGNINSFEVDGYPKQDKEYKAFIEEIINEDLFKMLTSPAYFPNMKWKEQREILMRFATTESDLDIAKRIGGFDDILDELDRAPKTEDIQKKYAVQLKELKAKQTELPVRIDEISKQKVDYDVAELNLAKADLERQLSTVGNGAKETRTQKESELLDVEFAINALVTKANDGNLHKRRELDGKIAEILSDIKKKQIELSNITFNIEHNTKTVVTLNEHLQKLGKEYGEEEKRTFPADKWTFDESSTVCNSCGQILPTSRIDAIKKDFEKRKAGAEKNFEETKRNEMNRLIAEGNEVKNNIKELDKQNLELLSKKEVLSNAVDELKASADKLAKELNAIPEKCDMSANTEYNDLVAKKSALETEIEELGKAMNESEVTVIGLKNELEGVNKKLSESMMNDTIDTRIEELKAEQRDVSQKIANAEKMLYLVETFIKAKLDVISSCINEKFSCVKFKLFDVQINGGMTECCEMTMDGVPYSSLNNGHKIVGGLDIINTLSNYYDKHVFVFVDNAESINESNLPAMANQLVRLAVSEDKSLTVTEE